MPHKLYQCCDSNRCTCGDYSKLYEPDTVAGASINMSKIDYFKPEDFEDTFYKVVDASPADYATAANAKLAALIESAPVVYSNEDSTGDLFEWTKDSYAGHTATARLMFIEKLPVKECEHEPSDREYDGDKWLCKYCGVNLKATWSKA